MPPATAPAPTNESVRRLTSRSWFGPGFVSLAVLVAVTLTLDPADCRPGLPEGPGVTYDESFNVQMGVYLAKAVGTYGVGILHPASAVEVFGIEGYNADHPPLGRLWLGVIHEFVQAVAPPAGMELSSGHQFITVSARFGSACAFALTVFLVGFHTASLRGAFAGSAAAVSLALMPRLFGHAHLASLESITGLTWTLAILGALRFWPREKLRFEKRAGLCGFLIGLALLTKMQAILLPPLILIWSVWHFRRAAIKPLIVAGLVAGMTFFIGWPWLWFDFPHNIIEYFARTTDRFVLHVWYFGKLFDDVDVPWHYPWVMFIATVPIGTLLLGGVGIRSIGRRFVTDPQLSLIAGSILAPLVLFSLPGVAVYDGARLFLVAFPGFAMLAGVGADCLRKNLCTGGMETRSVSEGPSRKESLADASGYLWEFIPKACLDRPTAFAFALLAAQSIGVITTMPHWLSYYSSAVGGVPGANSLGLETTYWGDAFSRSFLRQVVDTAEPGDVIEVAPVLHPFYLEDLYRQAPMLREKSLILIPYNLPSPKRRYLIVFHRKADAPTEHELTTNGWKFVLDERIHGAALASLWIRDES